MDRSRRPLAVVLIAVVAIVAVALGILATRPSTSTPVMIVLPTPTADATAPPTVQPPPTLQVDGLAAIASAPDLVVHRTPTANGKALTPGLESGDIVYLTDGPKTVDGVSWWEVQPDWTSETEPSAPFGWIRATDDDGQPTLEPFAPKCPTATATVDPAAIAKIHTLRALACFGDRPLVTEGVLSCASSVRDGGAGGVPWRNSYWWCRLDDALAVNGPQIDALQHEFVVPSSPVAGRYRATGHFDDPQARRCHMLPIGISLDSPGEPEPEGVIWCRQDFVVTELTKLD